ncbi:MAG: AAA family ATPase [Thiotrichales bacterium]|nr:AAA family ATPase [Thiotrichales bacterium]
MYKKFFGLKELPFRNNLDSNYFYEKASRLEILNALVYVIKRGDAVIKVTGEVGSGKTTLLRLTSLALSEGTELIYINAPNLTPKDLLFTIAAELCVENTESISKYQLLQLIREKLLEHHYLKNNVVVLVDEAQSMSVNTLEELRLLTNLETEKDKLIQLVLFGQQELDVALDKQALRQLKSRITYSIHIPQLTEQDVYDYLNHRMRIAEYKGLDFFSFKDAKKIQKLTSGLPRTINVVADQLLMAAFGSGDRQLKPKHYENLNSIQMQRQHSSYRNPILIGMFLSFLIGFFILIILYKPVLGTQQSPIIDQTKVDIEPLLPVKQDLNTEFDLDFNLPDDVSFVVINQQKDTAALKLIQNDESMDTTKSINKDLSSTVESTVTSNAEANAQSNDLTSLYSLHKETEAWLTSLKDTRYVIQLSTTTPRDYKRLLQSYSNDKNFLKNVHFMLALNDNESKLILKSLYLASSSYTTLSNELLKLPEDLRLTKPFIVNLSSLKASAKHTSQKLEAMEVR